MDRASKSYSLCTLDFRWHIRFILWVVVENDLPVFYIVEILRTIRHTKHHLELHPRMNNRLLEHPYCVSMA